MQRSLTTLAAASLALGVAPLRAWSQEEGDDIPVEYEIPVERLDAPVDIGATGELTSDEEGDEIPVERVEGGDDAGVVIDTPASPSGVSVEASVSPAQIAVPEAAPTSTMPALTGLIGVVTDALTGEPVIDATVKAERVGRGAKTKAKTVNADLDGRYQLVLEPGEYEVRVYYAMYETQTRDVTVAAGEAVAFNVSLRPKTAAVQEVLVETKADTRTEAAVLQERKRSVVAVDVISAQEIQKTPDSTASDSVKRVVSATVIDNRYIAVRGLSGRYVTALLNGVVIPSPEPDEPSVPLDVFPTNLLANLSVAKTYGVENPATFGGATLRITSNTYPREFELRLRGSISSDHLTLGQDTFTYTGGGTDFWGWDDGVRQIPSEIPTDQAVRPDNLALSNEQLQQYGRAFPNIWSPTTHTGLPNFTLGATVGDTVETGSQTGKVGYLASLLFTKRNQRRTADIGKVKIVGGGDTASPEELQYREQASRESGGESAQVSALANVGWQPNTNNDIGLLGMYTHSGDKLVQFGSAPFDETDAQPSEQTRLQYIERELAFGQLTGFHRIPEALRLELKWQGNYAVTNRNEPDTRDLRFNYTPDGVRRFRPNTGSGERFYSALTENSYGGGLEIALPVSLVTMRVGGSLQNTERDFAARRFLFLFNSSDPAVLFLPPEQMFAPQNIGPGEGTSWLIEERTQAEDAYTASRLVYAGYAAIEVKPVDVLTLVPGVRYESAVQKLTPGSPVVQSATPLEGVDRTDPAVVPSFNAIYAVAPEMNLRAAYSYTLARPQFRELAAFLYYDFSRNRAISGNPALLQTRIHNADIRWEWFINASDLLAATVFFKEFADPIESVIVNANADVSFTNAKGARAAGVELEGRYDFGHALDALSGLRLAANASFVYSRIELDPAQQTLLTNSERAMQGQSPWTINAVASYEIASTKTEFSLAYNVAGPRIFEVGINGLPDVYEQPVHRLDLTVTQPFEHGFNLRVSGSNLANQDQVLTQSLGDVELEVQRFRPGVAGTITLEWRF